MPLVSVVIPAYNAERYLAQTLASAVSQSHPDLEVVVVNDGSKDRTGVIARDFGPKVRVMDQANAGMSASRNRGIDSGDSEFVALLDSDDIWHRQKLELQLCALRARPEAAFCFTGFTWWYGDTTEAWFEAARTATLDEQLSGWIYHQLILDNWALPSSLMFRRTAWQQLGPFLCENQQTDDWEYIVRASRQFQYLKLRDSFVLYRQLPGSLSKRMPDRNVGELMRESLIQRFGLASPDGTPVDHRALNRQRYKGWRNFADAHVARGDVGLGLREFARLLKTGPQRADTLMSVVKATRRRLFPKP